MKLHLGCGNTRLDGWVNVDITAGDAVDVVCDLDVDTLPFDDDSVDESFGSHVLEHLRNPLHFMGELWRVTKPGGTAKFLLPYGSSDDAWEDPTHVRPYFIQSSIYFGQPAYWRADYGYVADWDTALITLALPESRYKSASAEQAMEHIMSFRNVVLQMTYDFVAVKPARPREPLEGQPNIQLALVQGV